MVINNKKIKRIGIDARFYGPIGKGLGRYTQELVDNIIKIDNENQYVVFLTKENFDKFKTENPNVKKVLADIRWYTLAEQILFPMILMKEKLDIVHFPHFNAPIFYPKKFIVTIHDLIVHKFPDERATTLNPFIYKIKLLFYKAVIWSAVKRAKKIIAVSNFTKQDIINEFKIDPDKITVIYEGVSTLSKKESKDEMNLDDNKILLGYNINNPYLLYTGNAYPHKNLEKLIKVFFAIIKKYRNLSLVLVGKEDYFYKNIKDFARGQNLYNKLDKNDFVKFLGYVPDSHLRILYKNAVVYIFPSYYEGFGLPALEAMVNDCPVLSSNKSSLPEVLGQAAVYFNPESEEEMQTQIESIINNGSMRQELISQGRAQIKKYSWEKCAAETLNIYKLNIWI